MTTVSAVKRALQEAAVEAVNRNGYAISRDLRSIAASPTACTILANRLSDRGEAGNAATWVNLAELLRLKATLTSLQASAPTWSHGEAVKPQIAALEWAIDQLTPPERAQP